MTQYVHLGVDKVSSVSFAVWVSFYFVSLTLENLFTQ